MPTWGMRIWLVVVVVLLAGCGGLISGEAEGPAFDDPDHEEQFEAVVEALDGEEADAFEAAITDDGAVIVLGGELLDRLIAIEAVGVEQRDAVARSVGESGEVNEYHLAAIDRVLASPEAFQETVFLSGIDDSTGSGVLDGEKVAFGMDPAEPRSAFVSVALEIGEEGYTETDIAYLERVGGFEAEGFAWQQAEVLGLLDGAVTSSDVAALEDTSGDGLLDGMSVELGLDPETDDSGVAEVAEPLAQDGYDDVALVYLHRVANISVYEGHPYEVWTQAEELGLLTDTVADGEVSEEEVWLLENDADNRLLNGMEESIGTNPALADTSGDGYPDHLKWGPMEDLGWDVHPAEPDVYVEVDATTGVDQPAADELAAIQETFREEPPDGPIHVHFIECHAGLEPADTAPEILDRTDEHRDIRGMGVHYLLVNDGPFEWQGEHYSGLAWLGQFGEPFMMARGDIPTDEKVSLIAHELGHKLGIFAGDFAGVDSREYTFDEYNSVMNYNRTTEITFSTGEPFDDYAHMADRNFGSEYEPIDQLEAMWEEGEVPNEALCG